MIGIDLFSGAGGMSTGAVQAGINVEVAVEYDKHAAATYSMNHPRTKMFVKDIGGFAGNLIPKMNRPFIVFGGPPCQGFSTSNQKTRSWSNSSNWLFQEFMRVTKFYMPDWVVIENVRGIIETEKGVFVSHMMEGLKRLGYKVTYEVLNSVDFGVPQCRSRFFMVGSLHGVNFHFPPTRAVSPPTVLDAFLDLPKVKNGSGNDPLPYSGTAKSEYAKMLRQNANIAINNGVTNSSPLIIERYKNVPQGGNWADIPDNLMSNYKNKKRCHTGIYRRLVASKPSVVIGNYRKNMLIHPFEDRGLSVREAARLQSFPDSYEFMGSIGFQQQQVGNAVPPLLAKAVFNQIVASSNH